MNSKHINGITVVSLDAGEKLGSVNDIVFEEDGRRIAALGVHVASGSRAADLADPSWLTAKDVHAIGPDALTVQSVSALHDAPPADATLHLGDLLKRKVVTENGAYVGQVASVEIADAGPTVTAIEVSPGLLKSNLMIPIDQVANIGEEMVIVSDAVVANQTGAESEPAPDTGHLVGDVEPLPRS
jgi:sporulation protein YlmC with PRC-barrel domain